jgi:NADPH-ferrihemoprotein reductase
MGVSSTQDVIILGLGIALAAGFLFRDQIFGASKPAPAKTTAPTTSAANDDSDDDRDFVAKLKAAVSVSFHRLPPFPPPQRLYIA